MSSVIVDNSTLTAIQRLVGDCQVAAAYDVQGDYSALENYLMNLLMYDDLYFIDDYKDEFRKSRESRFCYLRSVPVDSFPYEEIQDAAKEATQGLILDVRGGVITPGLVKEFLESIGLHLTAAWHMSSSNYFLVLKVLSGEGGDEIKYKYSPLSSLIYGQSFGRDDMANDERMRLVNSDGEDVVEYDDGKTKYRIDGSLISFARSLNWLALRSAFYVFASSYFDSSVCPHPIRHNFISRWAESSPVVRIGDAWRHEIGNFFGERAKEAVNTINAATDDVTLGMSLPPIAAWAVGVAGSVSGAIEFILNMRNTKSGEVLRCCLNEVEGMRRENPLEFKKKANGICREIEREAGSLLERYNAGGSLEAAPVISFSASLPFSVGVGVSPGQGLRKLLNVFSKEKHVKSLFRNVVMDVSGFDSLGKVRGMMLREIDRDKTERSYILHVEEKRYFGRSSLWKRSM